MENKFETKNKTENEFEYGAGEFTRDIIKILLFMVLLALAMYSFMKIGQQQMVNDLCHKNLYDFCQVQEYTLKKGFDL